MQCVEHCYHYINSRILRYVIVGVGLDYILLIHENYKLFQLRNKYRLNNILLIIYNNRF